MALQPNEMLGPYRIAGLLGEGGMGAVYRARDTRLGRDVAVKVLTSVTLSDRERLLRFEQEARTTGMLNHPNLLTIYDVGRDGTGSPFLVSELLEGETLSSRLMRGPLSPRKAVDAALQMANGLAAAHEKGIVHRDLKPDNIFLTRDGRLKILDFGIAKLSANASGEGPAFEMAATEPGMVLGTVGYMSPEQVRGEPVDHRSDIFSLGAIFYEMLTGQRAFKRNSGIETLGAILKEDPPELTEILPNIPPALERLVRRCLEKDRELRFQSARDLGFHLETLSTMSQTANTLSARPSQTAATTAIRPTPPAAAPAPAAAAPAATPRTAAVPAPTAARRPLAKPKPRVSPVLLALLFVAAVAGAAYGGWKWAQRGSEAAVEPTFHRLTFRRGEVRSARFTPDGQTIVYTAAWDGQPSDIYISTGRAAEARQLGIPDSEVLAVSKSAELAVLLHRDRITRGGTLARVPLGGGMPRPLADAVLQADWSPDGSSLAVIRLVGGKTRVEYPLGTVRYETTHEVRHLRVSPDGTKLVILERTGGAYDVAIIDNGAPEAIARGWSRGAGGVAWSPGGRQIYISGTDTTTPPALYVIDIETGTIRLVSRLTGFIALFDVSPKNELLMATGNWRASLFWKIPDPPTQQPTQPPTEQPSNPATQQPPTDQAATLTPTPTPEIESSWFDWSVLADLSHDGRTILFSETREGGGAKAAVYLRRAGEPSPVRLGDGMGDALSPDGKWALVHQDRKLVLIPTGTGDARELKIDGVFDNGAAWFADSRRIVIGGAVGKDAPYQLHIIDTLDETAKPLTPPIWFGGGTRALAVSPDGRFVAGMTRDETIALYPVDGSAPTPVTGAEKGEIPIQWSADGASLLVYRPTALPCRIYRVHLATGTRELWRELSPTDLAGVYRLSPVLITPDAQGWAYNAMRTMADLYVAEGMR